MEDLRLEKPAWSEAEDGLRKCSDNTVRRSRTARVKSMFTCLSGVNGLLNLN